MTDKADALRALIEKVEAGECRADEVAGAAYDCGRALCDGRGEVRNAYAGSLDAAKALHNAVITNAAVDLSYWPGGRMHVTITETHEGAGGDRWQGKDDRKFSGTADTFARAWLLAIFRAILSMEGEA